MRKILLLLVLSITAGTFAQSKEDVEIIQTLYGKSKTELVKQYLNLTDAQRAVFQPIYDKYETERKKYRSSMIMQQIMPLVMRQKQLN